MPKFLFRGRYSSAGAAGLLKEGGSGRSQAIQGLVTSVGGTVEAMYWTFGADDILVIADLPDSKAAAAVSLSVGAAGAVELSTAELLTVADVDELVRRRVDYRPPGS